MNMGTSELWERMKMFEGTRPRNSSSLQQFNVTLLHFLFGCCLPQRRFRPAYILVYSSFSQSCPFLSPTRMIFIQSTLVPQDECAFFLCDSAFYSYYLAFAPFVLLSYGTEPT